MNYRKLAKLLGWFSIGIGIAELVATKRLGRMLQMEEKTGLLRGFGVREIANGVGIIAQPMRAPWVWARVGGDLLDLTVLGRSLKAATFKKGPVIAAAAVAGITALDVLCGQGLSARRA